MFLLLACVSFYLFFPFVPVWDLVGFLNLGISARCSARAWVYIELQKTAETSVGILEEGGDVLV